MTTHERDNEEEAFEHAVLREAEAREAHPNGWLYLVGEEGDDEAVMIGYTAQDDPQCWLAEFQHGNPRTLCLLAAIRGTEQDALALYRKHAAAVFPHYGSPYRSSHPTPILVLCDWYPRTPEIVADFKVSATPTA